MRYKHADFPGHRHMLRVSVSDAIAYASPNNAVSDDTRSDTKPRVSPSAVSNDTRSDTKTRTSTRDSGTTHVANHTLWV
jgi:hypothetical protein